MSKRKSKPEGEVMSAEARTSLVGVMQGLAETRPEMERTLNRLARVGELHEVERHILKLRAYRKRAAQNNGR